MDVELIHPKVWSVTSTVYSPGPKLDNVLIVPDSDAGIATPFAYHW